MPLSLRISPTSVRNTLPAVQLLSLANTHSSGSDMKRFDSEAYVRQMVAEQAAHEREVRRCEREPYVSIGVRAALSLFWTPLVIFLAYAVRWEEWIPSLDPSGFVQARRWPWLVGSFVLTSCAAFYGIAVGLCTKGGGESRRIAV